MATGVVEAIYNILLSIKKHSEKAKNTGKTHEILF